MMSQINTPIHSYDHDHKSTHLYYQLKLKSKSKTIINSRTRRDKSIWSISWDHLRTAVFFTHDCLFVCLENLAVQPNYEKPIFHEVGFAQNTISKTGNSLQSMGYSLLSLMTYFLLQCLK